MVVSTQSDLYVLQLTKLKSDKSLETLIIQASVHARYILQYMYVCVAVLCSNRLFTHFMV